MRISDWSSDVCSSDLFGPDGDPARHRQRSARPSRSEPDRGSTRAVRIYRQILSRVIHRLIPTLPDRYPCAQRRKPMVMIRSEEHTSELQSLMRISYAVFCLKKKTKTNYKTNTSRN